MIVVGQWGTARVAERVVGFLPSSLVTKSPLAGAAIANGAAALATSMLGRYIWPKYSRLLAAAAWAQAITSTVGSTATGARILSGNFAAPSAAVTAGAGGVAGYASGARARLAGYASGYNVTAGRAPGMSGYTGEVAAGAGMRVGGF